MWKVFRVEAVPVNRGTGAAKNSVSLRRVPSSKLFFLVSVVICLEVMVAMNSFSTLSRTDLSISGKLFAGWVRLIFQCNVAGYESVFSMKPLFDMDLYFCKLVPRS